MPPNLIVSGTTLNWDLYSAGLGGGWNALIASDAGRSNPTILSVEKSSGWTNYYPLDATGTIS